MEALFRKVLEKTQPFKDSKTLLKIPKLTPMVRLGNRTYRAWRNIELPKYFIKLHLG